MRVKASHVKVLMIAGVTALTVSYQACTPGGFRANPARSTDRSQFAAFENGGTTTDNPKPTMSLGVGAFENAIASEESLQIFLCVTEIRFGQNDGRVNVENGLKMLQLDPSGTLISGQLAVPVGHYDQIELRLQNDCNGLSAVVKNQFGEFKVDQGMDVNFRGNLSINGNLTRLVLDMKQMVAELRTAKNSKDVVEALDVSEGGCSGN